MYDIFTCLYELLLNSCIFDTKTLTEMWYRWIGEMEFYRYHLQVFVLHIPRPTTRFVSDTGFASVHSSLTCVPIPPHIHTPKKNLLNTRIQRLRYSTTIKPNSWHRLRRISITPQDLPRRVVNNPNDSIQLILFV